MDFVEARCLILCRSFNFSAASLSHFASGVVFGYNPGIPLGCQIQFFFNDFNMVFDTIGRYEFDTLWIWGCDFDMVLLCFWYGLGYGLHMVLDVIDTVSIWFQWVGFKKRNRNNPGTGFWSIFRRFLWFYVLIWFWYDFDTILTRFWYDFDAIFIRFWHDFDTILIRFWYSFDMVTVCRLQKKNQKQPRDRFLVNLSRFFFAVLIWFWHGFDAILIRFWYAFDTILIWFWVLIWFWIWFRWVGFKSQFWPTSRIITETISESYLNPYQHHNCKTTPGTIHNNKSYLKRIKIIKKNILKNLHPRDFGCYKSLEFSPRPCNLRDCLSIVTHTLSLYGTLTQKRLKLIVSEWTEHWVHATGWAWIYSQISRTEKVRTGMVKNKYQKMLCWHFL